MIDNNKNISGQKHQYVVKNLCKGSNIDSAKSSYNGVAYISPAFIKIKKKKTSNCTTQSPLIDIFPYIFLKYLVNILLIIINELYKETSSSTRKHNQIIIEK